MFVSLIALLLALAYGANSAIPTTGDLLFHCAESCSRITIEYKWECPYTDVLCDELSLTMQYYLTSSQGDVEYSLLNKPGTILGHRNYTFQHHEGDKYRGAETMIAMRNQAKPKYIVFMVDIHNNGVVLHRNPGQVCTIKWNRGRSQQTLCMTAAEFENSIKNSQVEEQSTKMILVITLSVCIPVVVIIFIIITVLCCLRQRKLRQRKRENAEMTERTDITFVNTEPPQNVPVVRQIARSAGRATTTAVPSVRYSKQTGRQHHTMLTQGTTSCENPSYDSGTSKKPPSYDQVASENDDDHLYQNYDVSKM